MIDRRLASEEYGRNWANYWSDTIGYRQQEPELTYHDYRPFKSWLTGQFNEGKGWDESVFLMLTSHGKVGTRGESTLIAFHQGNPNRLAGETLRVFHGTRISCAECHADPFVDGLTQEMFHGVAAYFARTDVKIAQLNSNGIDIRSKSKGEHKYSGLKGEIVPDAFGQVKRPLGTSDLDRREAFAYWLVSGDSPAFARAYVNRVWARLMGRGFVEPIDNMGKGVESKHELWMPVLDALADQFVASGYDTKSLFRVILNTNGYQRMASGDDWSAPNRMGTVAKKLRGDEVFQSLTTAINLPNVTPERQKKTAAVRFPPPAKSTQDLVNEAFGFDPSFDEQNVPRTMKQAMFMMNNPQIQAQVSAAPDSGTMLAKLLKSQADDNLVTDHLYFNVLARYPSSSERSIVLDHVGQIEDRGPAFEDVLWSLLNSTEFTTRR